MVGKKIFGLLLSMSLLASTSANAYTMCNTEVQASTTVMSTKYESEPGYVRANEKAIIEMLRMDGKIPQDATEEQIQEILSDYLKKNSAAQNKPSKEYKPSKQQMLLDSRIREKLKKYSEQDRLFGKGEMNLKTMEVEDWSDEVHVTKPLVVLIDFPDYKYSEITEGESKWAVHFDDYSTEHYEEMLFLDKKFILPNGKEAYTMKQYYLEQSGGSFEVDGDVTKWYTASKNAIAYGKQKNGNYDADARSLVKEAIDLAAKDYDLTEYDKEDIYDLDGDGNYYEPDGIIDHLIIVHAGYGEEDGGGFLRGNAIWSHRWDLGEEYEVTDKDGNKINVFGYTMFAQNSGNGVVSHEFGHDLGLPDEYDTQATSYYGEPIQNWSIMANGSWTGEIEGTEPTGFSPYAKQILQANFGGNWQKQTVISLDDISAKGETFVLDQAAIKGSNIDCVRIDLPKKTTVIVTPASGEKAYFGGTGEDGDWLVNSMTTVVNLSGKESAALKFKANYDMEEGYDFASIQVREVGTDEWVVLEGNITTTEKGFGAALTVPHGITGTSYGYWEDAEFDLTAFAGKNIVIKFAYETDPFIFGTGFFVDDIKVEADEEVIFEDDAETTGKFTFDGFTADTGKSINDHYYLLEWRNHQGVDAALSTIKDGDIEVPYEPGLLIWYVDEFYKDNYVGNHPGNGFLGVVDADQSMVYTAFYPGATWKSPEPTVFQIHDATFGLRETRTYEHYWDMNFEGTGIDDNGFMNPIFDDSKDYSSPSILDAGRAIPKYGLKIIVEAENSDRSSATIRISK